MCFAEAIIFPLPRAKLGLNLQIYTLTAKLLGMLIQSRNQAGLSTRGTVEATRPARTENISSSLRLYI